MQGNTPTHSQGLPTQYSFVRPQDINLSNVTERNSAKISAFLDLRIGALRKIMEELLRSEERHHEEEDKITRNALEFIGNTINVCNKTIEQETQERDRLRERAQKNQAELEELTRRYEDSRENFRQIQQSIKTNKREMLTANDRKNKAAETLIQRLEQLKDIHIQDPHSIANELFKWFLGVIYGEALAKYEFVNFKSQTLKKDKGVDFCNRLRGLNAFDLTKEEVAQTEKILGMKDQVVEALTKGKANPAVEASFEYIKVVDEIDKLVSGVKNYETQTENAEKKANLSQAELERLQTRQNDTLHGVGISERAITTFTRIREIFQNTARLCETRLAATSNKIPVLKQKSIQQDDIQQLVHAPVVGAEEEEETVQGGTATTGAGVKKTHAGVYETAYTDAPPQQKEGCQCTIF